jgi:uncharacterized protein (TIGR03382 family)
MRRALLAVSLAAACGCAENAGAASSPPLINEHPVVLDGSEKLLSWSRADSPYAEVSRLAWSALKTRFPVQEDTGYRTFITFSRFDPQTGEGVWWPHNPASLYAMLAESALDWYSFSGDAEAIDVAREGLDHMLAHGMTPAGWEWAGVPFSSADPSSPDYGGADDEWCDWCGRGDGVGVIEPDKAAELGLMYLRFYEATSEDRYKDAAVSAADALARHVRPGDETRSPWPFRVYAKNGSEREAYTAHVLPAIQLFDELSRLSIGDADVYGRARSMAYDWLMQYPMKNDAWSGYFEDIPIFSDPQDNVTQYVALQTARWLLEHPEQDEEWRAHSEHILSWVKETFGDDANDQLGVQYGARVLSEQRADMAKMGSHTARYAAVNALFAERTGDPAAREAAFRSFNWATYMCDENGIVSVSEDRNEGYWFSDGYGDYIRQFMVGMGALPEWAPAHEDHVLRTTSVVRDVSYATGELAYETFDGSSTDVLRLRARPVRVTAGDVELAARRDLDEEGYTVQDLPLGGVVLRVRHDSAKVAIELGDGVVAPAAAAAPIAPRAGGGCDAGGGAPGGGGWLLGVLAALGRRRRRA